MPTRVCCYASQSQHCSVTSVKKGTFLFMCPPCSSCQPPMKMVFLMFDVYLMSILSSVVFACSGILFRVRIYTLWRFWLSCFACWKVSPDVYIPVLCSYIVILYLYNVQSCSRSNVGSVYVMWLLFNYALCVLLHMTVEGTGSQGSSCLGLLES